MKRTALSASILLAMSMGAQASELEVSEETAFSAFADDAVVTGGIYNLTRMRDRQRNGSSEFDENI